MRGRMGEWRADGSKYTFTGQYSYMDDPSTQGAEGFGLMFYNARWYDPLTGRMIQADSIVPNDMQGLDRYLYTANNPVRYTDPSGHDWTDCGNRVRTRCEIHMRKVKQAVENWAEQEYYALLAILESAVHIGFVGYGYNCLDTAAGEECYEKLKAGLGTVLGNMNTIVTAYHILANSLLMNHDIAYIKIENANGDVVRISLEDLTLERIGESDVLIIHLKNSLPNGFAKPAQSAENFHPRHGQVIYTVYQQEDGKLSVASTMINGPIMYYACGEAKGVCLLFTNPNSALDQGDSGGGVFYNGQLIGVNNAIFKAPLYGPTLLIAPWAF